ncbi:MAG: hypothetical protein Q7T03_04990 [Deltaproteobacteria bacterium]|nr:hypothetical protein [Deltaproteobacteria bacterium]
MFQNKSRVFLLLLAIFSVSVLIRLPFLNRPVSRHHEDITAHALKPIETWTAEGALKYAFNHVLTYANPGDKYVQDEPSSIMDKNGNFYYVSRGTLSILLPFLAFKLFHISPTILSLQIFNLCLHFLISMLVYIVLSALFRKEDSPLNKPALLGFVIYVFSPVALWFHGNAYAAESLGQFFFILGLLLFLKWHQGEQNRWRWACLLGADVFFMICNDWLGLFLASVLLGMSLLQWRDREYRILSGCVAAAILFSVGLVLWQFSQIDGWAVYAEHAFGRLSQRTGFHGAGPLRNIPLYYMAAHLPFLIFLGGMFAFLFWKKEKISLTGLEKRILVLAILPVLFFDLVFINVTTYHAFFPLKATLYIALIAALLFRGLQAHWRPVFTAVFIGLILLSVFQFWFINRSPDLQYKVIGEKIRALARPDEVVFVRSPSFYPHYQILLYAKRNIAVWRGEPAARALLEKTGLERGIVFTLDKNTLLLHPGDISSQTFFQGNSGLPSE